MQGKVAVFGATGAQGSPVVAEACRRGLHVRALARDAGRASSLHPKAEAVAVDLNDAAAVGAALRGVDAAFAHLPIASTPDQPTHWLGNLLSGARDASLPLLVFSTSGPTGPRFPPSIIADGNAAAARTVLQSDVPSIVLKPTLYLKNLLPELFAPRLRSEGVLDYPPLSPTQEVSWTSHLDQALIAVAALTRADLAGRAFDIATAEPLTGTDLARHLSAWLAREVSYVPLDPAAFGARIAAALGNAAAGHVLSDLYQSLQGAGEGALKIDTETPERTFGVTLGKISGRIADWAA